MNSSTSNPQTPLPQTPAPVAVSPAPEATSRPLSAPTQVRTEKKLDRVLSTHPRPSPHSLSRSLSEDAVRSNIASSSSGSYSFNPYSLTETWHVPPMDRPAIPIPKATIPSVPSFPAPPPLPPILPPPIGYPSDLPSEASVSSSFIFPPPPEDDPSTPLSFEEPTPLLDHNYDPSFESRIDDDPSPDLDFSVLSQDPPKDHFGSSGSPSSSGSSTPRSEFSQSDVSSLHPTLEERLRLLSLPPPVPKLSKLDRVKRYFSSLASSLRSKQAPPPPATTSLDDFCYPLSSDDEIESTLSILFDTPPISSPRELDPASPYERGTEIEIQSDPRAPIAEDFFPELPAPPRDTNTLSFRPYDSEWTSVFGFLRSISRFYISKALRRGKRFFTGIDEATQLTYEEEIYLYHNPQEYPEHWRDNYPDLPPRVFPMKKTPTMLSMVLFPLAILLYVSLMDLVAQVVMPHISQYLRFFFYVPIRDFQFFSLSGQLSIASLVYTGMYSTWRSVHGYSVNKYAMWLYTVCYVYLAFMFPSVGRILSTIVFFSVPNTRDRPQIIWVLINCQRTIESYFSSNYQLILANFFTVMFCMAIYMAQLSNYFLQAATAPPPRVKLPRVSKNVSAYYDECSKSSLRDRNGSVSLASFVPTLSSFYLDLKSEENLVSLEVANGCSKEQFRHIVLHHTKPLKLYNLTDCILDRVGLPPKIRPSTFVKDLVSTYPELYGTIPYDDLNSTLLPCVRKVRSTKSWQEIKKYQHSFVSVFYDFSHSDRGKSLSISERMIYAAKMTPSCVEKLDCIAGLNIPPQNRRAFSRVQTLTSALIATTHSNSTNPDAPPSETIIEESEESILAKELEEALAYADALKGDRKAKKKLAVIIADKKSQRRNKIHLQGGSLLDFTRTLRDVALPVLSTSGLAASITAFFFTEDKNARWACAGVAAGCLAALAYDKFATMDIFSRLFAASKRISSMIQNVPKDIISGIRNAIVEIYSYVRNKILPITTGEPPDDVPDLPDTSAPKDDKLQSSTISDVCAAISNVLESLFMPGLGALSAVAVKFNSLFTTANHLKSVWSYIIYLGTTALNWLSQATFGTDVVTSESFTFFHKVNELVNKKSRYMMITQDASCSIEDCTRFMAYYREVDRLLILNTDRSSVCPYMVKLRGLAESLTPDYVACSKRLLTTGNVCEAVSVLLYGKPGTGKSSLVPYLVRALHDTGHSRNAATYTYPISERFEESYVDQSHYVVDEFMTLQTPENIQQAITKVLASVNSAPRPVPKAALAGKGLVIDTSEFVYLTTNQNLKTIDHLCKDLLPSAGAMSRRFHVSIEILPGYYETQKDGTTAWKECDSITEATKKAKSDRLTYATCKYNVTDRYGATQENVSLKEVMEALISARQVNRNAFESNKIQRKEDNPCYMVLQAPVNDADLSLYNLIVPMHTKQFDSTKPRKSVAQCFERLKRAIPEWYEFNLDYENVPLDRLGSALVYAYRTSDDIAIARLSGIIEINGGFTYSNDKPLENDHPLNRILLHGEKIREKFVSPCKRFTNQLWRAVTWPIRYVHETLMETMRKALTSPTMLLIVGTLVAAATAFSYLFGSTFFRGIFGGHYNAITVNLHQGGERSFKNSYSGESVNRDVHIKRAKENKPRPFIVKQAEFQSASADVHTNAQYLSENYCYICPSAGGSAIRGVFVHGRAIMTNTHALDTVIHSPYFQLKVADGSVYRIATDDIKDKVFNMEATDISCVILPNHVPERKSILHRFISERNIDSLGTKWTRYMNTPDNTKVTAQTFVEQVEPSMMFIPQTNTTYLSLTLPLVGYLGDCGMLLSCDDAIFQGSSFCGMHFYGNALTNSGFTIVTRELLSALLSVPTTMQSHTGPFEPTPEQLETIPSPPGATNFSTISPPSRVNRKSSLQPTMFYGLFGRPGKQPATLSTYSDAKGRDPMLINMKKQVRDECIIDESKSKLLKICAALTLKHDVQKHMKIKTLTLDEVIMGNEYVRPMILDSAAGYPFNTMKPKNSSSGSLKSDWIKINHTDKTYEIDEFILKVYTDALESYRKGERPVLYYAAQLKDEIRDNQKIADCKTRIYYVGCIINTMIGRALFGSLMRSVELSRPLRPGQMSVAIGISERDSSILDCYKLMTNPDISTIALDQEGFDYHQNWSIAQHLVEPINKRYCPDSWETDPDCIARKTYLEHMYHATIVVDSVSYQHPGGLMSGCPITAPFNSLYLHMVTLATMTEVYVDNKTADPTLPTVGPNMLAKTYQLYYGDDSINFVPKSYGITAKKMIDKYVSYGLKTTHCVKDADPDAPLPIEQITFLKRHWCSKGGFILWRRSLQDIYDGVNYWGKNVIGDRRKTRSTLINLCFDISLHGSELYGDFVKKITDRAKEYGHDFDLPTFSQLKTGDFKGE